MREKPRRALWRDQSGAAAAEFALLIPLWCILFLAMFQAAVFFWANAGLQHALGEGARVAAIFSAAGKTNANRTADIIARIEATRFGIQPANMPAPTVTYGTTSEGIGFADINVQYNTKLVLFDIPAITLRGRQRVYLP